MANWWDNDEVAPAREAANWWDNDAPVAEQGATEAPSTAEDVLRSLGGGLRRGVEGLVGAVGSTGELQEAAVGWAAEKLGASDDVQQYAKTFARNATGIPFAVSASELGGATDAAIGPSHKPQTTAGEYARTIGEFAPNAALGPGRLAQRAAVQALFPALASETAGQVTEGSSFEPYARTAGALLGGLAPSAARRAISPLPISPERQMMVDMLRKEGVDLTAGQASGRKGLQYAESEIGGGAAANMMDRQGEQFTAAALKRAGIEADRASPEVIDAAFSRIGKQFDDLAAQTKIPFDQKLQDDLLNAAVNYEAVAGNVAPAVGRVMERASELAGKNGGVLAGEGYKSLRTEIGKLSERADGTTKMALGDVREALDDAVERHMPADFVDAWKDTRGQYKNMLVLEKAATGAGENAAMGLISPSQLRNQTVNQNRRAYARGKGDFSELARAGEALLKPLPNSGTASRTWARNAGTGALSVMGALAGQWAAGTPGAIAGMMIGSGVPATLGRALMTKPVRDYLGNQMARSLPTNPRSAVVNAILEMQRQNGGR